MCQSPPLSLEVFIYTAREMQVSGIWMLLARKVTWILAFYGKTIAIQYGTRSRRFMESTGFIAETDE